MQYVLSLVWVCIACSMNERVVKCLDEECNQYHWRGAQVQYWPKLNLQQLGYQTTTEYSGSGSFRVDKAEEADGLSDSEQGGYGGLQLGDVYEEMSDNQTTRYLQRPLALSWSTDGGKRKERRAWNQDWRWGKCIRRHGLPLEPLWSFQWVLVAEGGNEAKLSSLPLQVLIRVLYLATSGRLKHHGRFTVRSRLRVFPVRHAGK